MALSALAQMRGVHNAVHVVPSAINTAHVVRVFMNPRNPRAQGGGESEARLGSVESTDHSTSTRGISYLDLIKETFRRDPSRCNRGCVR